ncbi:hypothetical protein D9619_004244 [Psilocybe cf. subviscida]|uniref:F-box domain-containing protein n=1 Tax=Psilocybe cf. subviscida TaxID=2480587 RepID=A0A8H5BQ19_9AGAR|nr:hypothetical protein D9619_004244 [Psilocybe cf. subviscida]
MASQLKLGGHIVPDDLIEQICITLTPTDFLSFVQTCRYLYVFSSSDYIWHKIAGDLPLDVDPSQNWRQLPGTTLKALTINALKLDRNWQSSPSRIARITKVLQPPGPNGAKLLTMIPLGGEWVVAWDAVRTAQVSLWRLPGIADAPSKDSRDNLHTINPVQILNLDPEPENTFRVEAVRLEGANDIVLVSVMGVGVHSWDKRYNDVTIHKIDLKGREDDLDAPMSIANPYIIKSWSITRLRAETAFYYMQIFRSLVVIACKGDADSDTTHLIVFDTETESTYIIKSPAFSMFEPTRMQFKLYSSGTSTYIIMAGPYRNKINVLVRVMPPQIESSSAPASKANLKRQPVPSQNHSETVTLTFDDFAASIIDYSLSFSSRMEVHLSPEATNSTTPIETFTVIANTHAFMESPAQETTTMYRFPLLDKVHLINSPDRADKWVVEMLEPILRIPTPVDVTLEAMCIGKTGQRAVWSSRDWNMDEHVLMKAQLASSRVAGHSDKRRSFREIVTPLQPPSVVFPFQQGACRSLSFDEASSRAFAGLISGELYVLHFQS